MNIYVYVNTIYFGTVIRWNLRKVAWDVLHSNAVGDYVSRKQALFDLQTARYW